MLSTELAVALKDKLFGCKQGKPSKEAASRVDRVLRTAARELKCGQWALSMEEKKRVKPAARSEGEN